MPLLKERLDLKIIDTVFDPSVYGTEEKPINSASAPGKFDVRFYQSNGVYNYKVWLFLSGHDLPFVESVTYQLHETFSEPLRTVNRTPSNPDCRLEIWTWGIFQIKATVLNKERCTYGLLRDMNYGKLLESFGDSINYIEESPGMTGGARLITNPNCA